MEEAAEAGTSLEAGADWFAGVGVALVLLIGEGGERVGWGECRW